MAAPRGATASRRRERPPGPRPRLGAPDRAGVPAAAAPARHRSTRSPATRRAARCGPLAQQARLHRISPASGETRAILRLTSTPYSTRQASARSGGRRGPVVNRTTCDGPGATAVAGGGFAYSGRRRLGLGADDEASALMRYDPAGRRVVARFRRATALRRSWRTRDASGSSTTATGRSSGSTRPRTPRRRSAGFPATRRADDYAEGSLWVTGREPTCFASIRRREPSRRRSTSERRDRRRGRGAQHLGRGADGRGGPPGQPVPRPAAPRRPGDTAVVETLRPTAPIVVNGLASTGNALWIADTAGGRLYRIAARRRRELPASIFVRRPLAPVPHPLEQVDPVEETHVRVELLVLEEARLRCCSRSRTSPATTRTTPASPSGGDHVLAPERPPKKSFRPLVADLEEQRGARRGAERVALTPPPG